MAEAATREMIVGHFHHVFRLHRLPLGRSLGRPAARAPRCIPCKTSSLLRSLKLFREGRLVLGLDTRREPNVMQQSVVIVQPEEKGSDHLSTRLTIVAVTEAADDTVRAAIALYLLHTLAIACLVRHIETLRDDAIASSACRCKPALCVLQIQADRRKA